MSVPRHAFFRGRVVPYAEARIGVLTHALNYGTGVFGGVRAYWSPEEEELFVFRPADHFRRFLESARLLDMTLPDSPATLTDSLVALLRAEVYREDCYARPLAFYGDESIGVRLHNLTPELSIVAVPYGRYVENEEGLHATRFPRGARSPARTSTPPSRRRTLSARASTRRWCSIRTGTWPRARRRTSS
jgi:branched-chain amino acid aminotransferase